VTLRKQKPAMRRCPKLDDAAVRPIACGDVSGVGGA
jgi:hypothetical protein